MGKINVHAGDKWGRVECTEIDYRWKTIIQDAVEFESQQTIAILKCDCGKTVDVWQSEWKGKKKHSDCGCGLSDALDPKVPLLVYVSVELNEAVRARAREQGVSMADVVRNALRSVAMVGNGVLNESRKER